MSNALKAVVVTPGAAGTLRLADVPAPVSTPGEALLKVVKVGVCGTDRDIIAGFYGEAPPGSTELVIGHESLCRVQEGAGWAKGDLVVPTVRRSCPENCKSCANGQSDMCLTGNYREHGIKLLNGFGSEYAVTDARYLVKLDESLSEVGVLLEPLTIAEKGIEQAFLVQSQRMQWEPRDAVVLGAGAVGLLATCLLRLRGLEVKTVATRPAESLKARLVSQTGAEYVDAKVRPISTLENGCDIMVEATGNTGVALEAQNLIRPTGIASYLGVYRSEVVSEDAGKAFTGLVLGNRVHMGSVNANRRYFETGAQDLVKTRTTWPGLLESMLTLTFRLNEAPEAYRGEGVDDVKTVVEMEG